MKATFRLMQEAGVTGPVETVDVPDDADWRVISPIARAWAEGQTGHPWDVLTVEPEDGEVFEVEL
jgi:hypothetical protein